MPNERPRKPKPSKAQVEQRVNEVLAIRLAGAQLWDVREYVREKEQEDGSPWRLDEGQKPLSDSQLYRYIARADKLIASSSLASRKKLLRLHQARREYLYGLAVNQGDIRAALACLDSTAKLRGLYDDELTRQLDELQRQIEEIRRHGNGSPTATGGGAPGGAGGTGGTGEAPGHPGPGADAGRVR